MSVPEPSHLLGPPTVAPWLGPTASSNEVSNVKGHVLNDCAVDGFHVPRGPPVFCHYVDNHTLRARTSVVTNSVVIAFPVGGEVMVDG